MCLLVAEIGRGEAANGAGGVHYAEEDVGWQRIWSHGFGENNVVDVGFGVLSAKAMSSSPL